MKRRPSWVPTGTNYRGKQLPMGLGLVMVLGVVLWTLLLILLSWLVRGRLESRDWRSLVILAGLVLVAAAGLYDDLRPGPVRGLAGHMRELGRGRLTTGGVKLAATVVAAAAVTLDLDGRGWRLVLAVPVVAGATNLWNLLDVRPGRAVKWFIPVSVVLVAAARGADYTIVGPTALGAAVIVLPLDLRERSMLGDAGSNALGFVAGVGIFLSLSAPGLLGVLMVLVALHVMAETVTLSRLIEAAAPLRWYDRLGRVPEQPAEGPPGGSGR